MRLLPSMMIGPLALLTIDTAMAQPPAAPAPVAPATGVPLDEAVRGLIELCTDHALASPRIPYAQAKIKRLGFELRAHPSPAGGDAGYSMRAPTTAGVILISASASGSCRINVNTGAFYHAFSAALDSSTSYARDTSGPTQPNVTRWRSQKVLAAIDLLPGRYLVAMVRIAPVPQ